MVETGRGPERDEGLGSLARGMRAAEPWISAVWKLLGGAVVGVLGGYWMDKELGTGPWGTVGLSALGIVVGFYGFIRDALRLGRKG